MKSEKIKSNLKEKKIEKIDFRDQIFKNKFKSVLLLIFVFLIFLFLGYIIALVFKLDVFILLIFATVLSLVYVWISYVFCDKIALASVRAKKADPIKHKVLYDVVENISLASGLPMPKVYVMPGKQINAFATGRNPKNAVICVTEGALEKLNKQELEGVIGHEMSHIANYDIRFVTLTVVIVGAVSIFSQMFLRSIFFSGLSGGYRDNRRGGNTVFLILALVLAIVAPIAVKLVQLAISRKREYAADAGAVAFTRYPPGLIGALKKIQADQESLEVPGAVAPMFISEPTKKKILELFQTHPLIENRIKALEAM